MPINKVARAAIEELRSHFGVNDLTPDEVLELNDLGAAQIAAGKPRDGDERIASPVRVGNVELNPMTCAAQDFYERWQDAPIPAKLRRIIIPYAMSHAREPRVFASILSRKDLLEALRLFRRNAGATPEELDEAAADILAVDNASPEGFSEVRDSVLSVCDWVCSWDIGLGEPLRELCKARLEELRSEKERANPRGAFQWRKLAVELGALTGVSPDFWYEEDHVLALLAFRLVFERDRRKSPAVFADSGKAELVEAISGLRKAMARIVESREARKGKES